MSNTLFLLYRRAKQGAKRRKIGFAVSYAEVEDLYLAQGGRCALTGVKLRLGRTPQAHRTGATTASLDRIDSSKGYMIENLQWVHKTINRIKLDIPQKDFIDWCKRVANNART